VPLPSSRREVTLERRKGDVDGGQVDEVDEQGECRQDGDGVLAGPIGRHAIAPFALRSARTFRSRAAAHRVSVLKLPRASSGVLCFAMAAFGARRCLAGAGHNLRATRLSK